ncbi:hypothetical protein ACET3Z_021353 [Daucus carota]
MLSTSCLFLFALVVEFSIDYPLVLVHAQNGFVSIDCGLPEGSDYTVPSTGIHYQSDADYIDGGESRSLASIGNSPETYLKTLRRFPQGQKNCYTIKLSPGRRNKYLIRANFRYGNYDGLNELPAFDLNLGADTWSNIVIPDSATTVRKEIIHVLSSDYVHVCLIKTGNTTPFISSLELRPIESANNIYTSAFGSLQSLYHRDCTGTPGIFTRYSDDIFDRIWWPVSWSSTGSRTQSDINNLNNYRVPENVLRTASGPDNVSEPFEFSWDATSASDQFYVYLHFAEVVELQPNQSREFNIYLNEQLWYKGPFVPLYLEVNTVLSNSVVTGKTRYTISLKKTENSTLPPIINAYEIYSVKKFSDSGTNETDVSAILNIKSTYEVTKDWQGDPCEPQDFHWEGLNCSYPSSNHSARIISLSSGDIMKCSSNLTMNNYKTVVTNIKLSNQLSHSIIKFSIFRFMKLKGNQFTGPLPAQLLENQKNGILSLSYDDSGDKEKKNKYIPAIVATVLGLLLLAAILFGMWMIRGRRIRKDRLFTYSQVEEIADNFQEMLGKGGFGRVYRGSLDGTQVAVKILLSPPTTRSDFKNEVSLLMRIHHKNLTSMVGYCDEEPNMGIIYEYMAGRNLEEYLSGISNWVERLKIALDIAQGLEYLHHGCKPAIIHRDVKTTNVLLNEQFEAKLADFGLSRAYSDQGGTHVSTIHVAGTPGYIDPDYQYNNKKLTEKSDVFSFGVVLLVMITGLSPKILSGTEEIHISRWVYLNGKNGDVTKISDSRFGGKFDVNSMRNAIELALSCTSSNQSEKSSQRPTMNIVVNDLKVCLAIELGTQDADPNP